MSCTTHRVGLRDPIQDTKRIRYENLLLKIRIQKVRPAITLDQTVSKRKQLNRNKKPITSYGRRLQINQDNATLLKRILNLEDRIPIYGTVKFQKHLNRFFRNQQVMKKLSKRYEENARNRENYLLRGRLRCIIPTINVKKMHQENKLRKKVLKNMSRYRGKQENALNLGRLQLMLTVAKQNHPKTARKKRQKIIKVKSNSAR